MATARLEDALESLYTKIASGELTAATLGSRSEFLARFCPIKPSADKVLLMCAASFMRNGERVDHEVYVVVDKRVHDDLKRHDPQIDLSAAVGIDNAKVSFNYYCIDCNADEFMIHEHMHSYAENELLAAHRRLGAQRTGAV